MQPALKLVSGALLKHLGSLGTSARRAH